MPSSSSASHTHAKHAWHTLPNSYTSSPRAMCSRHRTEDTIGPVSFDRCSHVYGRLGTQAGTPAGRVGMRPRTRDPAHARPWGAGGEGHGPGRAPQLAAAAPGEPHQPTELPRLVQPRRRLGAARREARRCAGCPAAPSAAWPRSRARPCTPHPVPPAEAGRRGQRRGWHTRRAAAAVPACLCQTWSRGTPGRPCSPSST